MVVTGPALAELLFPLEIAVADWSLAGETRSLIEKNVAALLKGVPVPENVTVMVLLDRALFTGAEKTSVLTPLALLISASFVYVFPAVSVTAAL